MLKELIKHWEEYKTDFEKLKQDKIEAHSRAREKLKQDYDEWGMTQEFQELKDFSKRNGTPYTDPIEIIDEKLVQITNEKSSFEGYMDYLSTKLKEDEKES